MFDNTHNYYKKMGKYIELHKPAVKSFMLGRKTYDGFLYKLSSYVILFILGFVFLYPILYMFSTSMMSNLDLVDNTIRWIPSKLFTFNYEMSFKALKLPSSFLVTTLLAGSTTLATAVCSALVGYGLARFEFKGKKLVLLLMLFTFIVPKTLFFIPRYQLFVDLHLKGTIGAITLPALLGQGEQGVLFILIFYQFFKMIPKSLEEAAFIDGASAFKTFLRIAIPMVGPAFIIVAVYGFALNWNETFLTNFYLEGKIQTIPILLSDLQNSFGQVVWKSGAGDFSVNPDLNFTEAKVFAGTILSILPLVIMYITVQRWFVESIDKSGITGE